ncbi:MAG TPA: SDR family oxidoreductase [Actinomycetota bacterium]|nr:SDR family oxidoreductase [Actinomycetota bacterium]
MDIFIVGGHGKIALRFERLAAEAGHKVRAMVRNPDHSGDIEAVAAEPVVADIETDDITGAVKGADVVVFTAGAGPGSGPERKKTVDLGGAIKLIGAAAANGISRYLMVSAIGADKPSTWSEQMRPYYEAKAGADEALMASGLDYTIVRPGSLTDDPGTGLVDIAPKLNRSGRVPRDDVAAVLLASIDEANTVRKAFDLLSGDKPIEEALRSL